MHQASRLRDKLAAAGPVCVSYMLKEQGVDTHALHENATAIKI